MQVLAFVALCFLVLAHLHPLRGKVVISFQSDKQCLDFFYKRTVPKWNAANPKNPNLVCLCQRLNNRYHFATLYNTANRIPVYSAYRFQPSNDTGRQKKWFIEPQLENSNWTAEMKEERTLKKGHKKFGERQALNEDYTNISYDRGHLNPNGHHTGFSRNATFTLTNVVPQNRKLNNGNWSKYEMDLQKNLTNCSQAYVLVGAIPSANNWIIKNNTKRVNIPDYIWNAYCCLDKKGQLHSGGAIANNAENRVHRHTLSGLITLLKKYAKSKVFALFNNNCEPKRSIVY